MGSRTHFYILVDRVPVPELDVEAWAHWYEHTTNRVVARTYLGDGVLLVSTVFLGINHNFGVEGPPLLFETMVLNEQTHDWWDIQWRYATYEEAEKGHQAAVSYVVHHSTAAGIDATEHNETDVP